MIEHVNLDKLFDFHMGGSLPDRAMPLSFDFTLPIRLATLADGPDIFLNNRVIYTCSCLRTLRVKNKTIINTSRRDPVRTTILCSDATYLTSNITFSNTSKRNTLLLSGRQRKSEPTMPHQDANDFSAPAEELDFTALLFDMDGTIIDSTPAIIKYWHQVGKEIGVDGDSGSCFSKGFDL